MVLLFVIGVNKKTKLIKTQIMEDYSALWLRRRRLEMGLTQGELAKAIGLYQTQISKYELARNYPRKNHRDLFLKFFNLRTEENLVLPSRRALGKTVLSLSYYYQAYEKCKNLFKNGYHIMISGKDCGDIKQAIQILGLSPNRIIACDILPEARKKAQDYRVIQLNQTIQNTVESAVQKFGAFNISTINVDLCVSLVNGLPILQEVLENSKQTRAMIFFTFFVSRGLDFLTFNGEQKHYKEILKSTLKEKHYKLDQCKEYSSGPSRMATAIIKNENSIY